MSPYLIIPGVFLAVGLIRLFILFSRKERNAKAVTPASRTLPPSPTREKRHFFLQVHGITRRQAVLSKCRIGEELSLVLEPDNPYDAGAIKVCRLTGEHLGYIPADHSTKMTGEITSGWRFRVTVDEIYPFRDRPGSGCRIRLGVLRQSDRTEARRARKEAINPRKISP